MNEITKTGNGFLEGVVGSSLVYSAIHEDGGIIRPKRSQFLTIPVDPLKFPIGTTARDFPNAFFIPENRTPSGKALIARRIGKGKRAQLEVLFVLQRSVKIKPKKYLARAAKRSEPLIAEEFGRGINTAVRRVT